MLIFVYIGLNITPHNRVYCSSIYAHNRSVNVKIGRNGNNIQVKLLSFKEKVVYLPRLSSLCACLNSFSKGKQTANAELKAEKSKQLFSNKRAMGGMRVKTYRRRLSDAVFETSRILQTFRIIVSNMVNGRCPGCDYINPVETL